MWEGRKPYGEGLYQLFTSARTTPSVNVQVDSWHWLWNKIKVRFRVQFEVNLHEWVFQKAEIERADSEKKKTNKKICKEEVQEDLS